MNRFSDGFSDKTYDDLLNEYAGDSLPSKPVKKADAPPQQRVQNPNRYQSIESGNRPVSKRTPNEDSFDIDLLKAFEEAPKRREAPHEPKQGTRQFDTAQPQQKKGKFVVNIDSAKSLAMGVANKVKTSTENRRNAAREAREEEPSRKIFIKENGKTRFDKDAFFDLIITTVETNKKEFLVFGCCILVSIILSIVAISCVNDVLAISRDGEESIEVILPNEADTFDAIRVLDEAGLIKNSIFCNIFAKAMGFSDENYLPGIYHFTDDMGIEKMLTRFKTSSTRGTVIAVTIPEGYTVDQIFKRLEKNEICTADELYKVLNTVDFGDEYDFIAKLTETEDRYCVLEGYLYPATYEFEQDSEPGTVIRKMLDAFKANWTEEYAARATELGMSVDEIINLASIIEKEGNGKGQFLKISSVLHNRLNRSGVYPTLDCNSTKDYVTNTISKRVPAANLSGYILNYSTYDRAGLPPSAICNPGPDAIEAALYPTASQWYFFRHDKKGNIYMAETLEEHNANLRQVNKVNAED